MATPVNFKHANHNFGRPKGWKEKECSDLPVHLKMAKTPDNREVPESTSCWQLGFDELEEIKRTGVVWLSVWGSQPPVLVTGTSPFKSDFTLKVSLFGQIWTMMGNMTVAPNESDPDSDGVYRNVDLADSFETKYFDGTMLLEGPTFVGCHETLTENLLSGEKLPKLAVRVIYNNKLVAQGELYGSRIATVWGQGENGTEKIALYFDKLYLYDPQE